MPTKRGETSRAGSGVTLELAGVRQRGAALEPGCCYVRLYNGSACEALVELQLIIEASGAEDAVLASYTWPRTAAKDLRRDLDRLAIQGFRGTVGLFARTDVLDGDGFAAFALEAARAVTGLEHTVVLCTRAPEGLDALASARVLAAAGLVPVTGVEAPAPCPITDGMARALEVARLHAAPDASCEPFGRLSRQAGSGVAAGFAVPDSAALTSAPAPAPAPAPALASAPAPATAPAHTGKGR